VRILALVAKTVQVGIHKEVNRCKTDALQKTKEIYNSVIAFYMDFFVAHLKRIDELRKVRRKDGSVQVRTPTNQELLTFAEFHTLTTKSHPDPSWPLEEQVPIAKGMPAELRRAAINHAIGKVRAWSTARKKWEETPPEKRGREPQLGQPNEPVTFYAGMVDHPAYDLEPQKKRRHAFLSLKLFTGQRWEKVAFPVVLYPKADRLLAASQAEKARIKLEEKRLKTLEPDTKKWSKEQRALLRPQEWVAQSLTVYADKRVPGGVRYSLQIPMEKWGWRFHPKRRNSVRRTRKCRW
jgi:hypothetical protein